MEVLQFDKEKIKPGKNPETTKQSEAKDPKLNLSEEYLLMANAANRAINELQRSNHPTPQINNAISILVDAMQQAEDIIINRA